MAPKTPRQQQLDEVFEHAVREEADQRVAAAVQEADQRTAAAVHQAVAEVEARAAAAQRRAAEAEARAEAAQRRAAETEARAEAAQRRAEAAQLSFVQTHENLQNLQQLLQTLDQAQAHAQAQLTEAQAQLTNISQLAAAAAAGGGGLPHAAAGGGLPLPAAAGGGLLLPAGGLHQPAADIPNQQEQRNKKDSSQDQTPKKNQGTKRSADPMGGSKKKPKGSDMTQDGAASQSKKAEEIRNKIAALEATYGLDKDGNLKADMRTKAGKQVQGEYKDLLLRSNEAEDDEDEDEAEDDEDEDEDEA